MDVVSIFNERIKKVDWTFPVPYVQVKAYPFKPEIKPKPKITVPAAKFLLQPHGKFSEYWRNKLETELRSRMYSPQTRRAYIYYNSLICNTLRLTPEEINGEEVTQFLAIMEKEKNLSSASMNLCISAIKFFYRNVMKTEKINEPRRPRKDKRLPVVLSTEEVIKLFSMERNPKHRLLLMLVYSSGLRVSEVVNLKKENIDLSRKVILIRKAKGRKDRYTLLSDKAARFLAEYYEFYHIQNWLFSGQRPNHPITIRTAQHIFDKAIRKADINKKISIHGLRHTFATHLLENGTDIRYIQDLLGHSSILTTERYTHVAKRSVLNIKSPLDCI
jgi:site-specific recombinase XerD